MIRLACAVITALLFGLFSSISAVATPQVEAPTANVYNYDDPLHAAARSHTTSERGPPATVYTDTTHYAVDRWSYGASVRSDGPTPEAAFAYDHPVLAVQAVSKATPTKQRDQVASGDLRALSGAEVAANSGNRVFWSGGDVAKNAAADYAKVNGGKTLEMTLTGRALEKIPYNQFTKPVTGKLWDAASWRFARGARGDAHVFFGPNAPRPGSVFARIEGPILDRRGNAILQHFLE